MYVIVESRGRQYKVSPGDVVALDRLTLSSGAPYEFDKVVMLVDNEQKVMLDRERLDDVKVSGVVMKEQKDKKIFAFKYKRRKGYHKKIGHRQKYTLVQVLDIETPFSDKKGNKASQGRNDADNTDVKEGEV